MERPAPLRERLAGASPHLLLLVHGLCMNDTQWLRNGHDHGAFLAQALGCTPVYLRYNSGLHTSINGRELAGQLERLVGAVAGAIESITVLGHSMGGLLARAAVFYGRQMGHRWPAQLKHLVFLGTPHHGAPLERAGHGVDVLLAASPFTAPFTRLGMLRSAGITDLRHGHVLDDDWQGRGRFDSPHDHRVPLPLPEGVACFTVAATLAPQRGLLADRLTGDGLVPLRSALGQHDEAARRLVFAKDSQRTVYRTGHLELLSSPVVAQQLVQWLAPSAVERRLRSTPARGLKSPPPPIIPPRDRSRSRSFPRLSFPTNSHEQTNPVVPGRSGAAAAPGHPFAVLQPRHLFARAGVQRIGRLRQAAV